MGYLSTADQNMIAMAASRLEEVEIATARVEDEGRTYGTSNAAGERMIRPNPMVAQRSDASCSCAAVRAGPHAVGAVEGLGQQEDR
ncbi:P27 family phage terminase small subunit [Bosea sp. AK1]|uniref:P27 family phage terminase small subunit n=1 Tax=Bosea sp. AK1 TaxID=2587160 RepID=UPI00163A054C|nr:P27 family phage terminase small subunit [Bosea sp. AK1]